MKQKSVRAVRRAAVAAGALLAAQFCASAGAAQPGLSYDTEITGVDGELYGLLESLSRLVAGEPDPPSGAVGLAERAEGDRKAFEAALRSEGYYGAVITFDIDAAATPAIVHVRIDKGARYRVANCTLTYAPAPVLESAYHDCERAGLAAGAPARSADILAAEQAFVRRLQEHGYPDAKAAERRALVDHASQEMTLSWTLDPGAPVILGRVRAEGTERTDPGFLAELATWRPGEPYDVREVDAYRQRLSKLNLFSRIDIGIDGESAANEGSPVRVAVQEAPPRSIGGGLRYSTDEGPGAKFFWEHRNLMGRAERFRVSAGLSSLAQLLEFNLALPHTPRPGETIEFALKGGHEDNDAYAKLGGALSAAYSADWGGYWKAKIGAALEAADVDEDASSRFSVLGSLPLEALYDSTQSLLDPKRGERLVIHVEPAGGTSDGPLAFLVLHGTGTAYRALDDQGMTVVAARLKLGAILGAAAEALPPDKRLYAGGGGSVRGFPYQSIGPRDAQNDPEGGLWLGEAGLELRHRFDADFGAAAFVEAGTVSRAFAFADTDTVRVGAGLGMRYYTGVGPLRLDVAAPLNRISGDPIVQIYVSLGQAY